MKLVTIPIVFTLFILLGFTVNAEEKKIKLRGIEKTQEFEKIQINISPDLLKFDEFKKLKSNYKTAKNFAIETDKSLKKRKKIKFRSAKTDGSPGKIYSDFVKSVFFLYNADDDDVTKGSSGTGFLIDSSGLILSNWHVTKDAKQIYVWALPNEGVIGVEKLFANNEHYFGTVVAENKKEDLALIKVNGLPVDIKEITLGHNKEIKVGDDVYAIGHPKGLPWSFTAGMVSQKRKNYKWIYEDKSEHEATVIQMQTPISTGNSGGPLISNAGKVVGVNTLMKEGGQNLNFAIAVDHVRKFIKNNPNAKKINSAEAVVKKEYPNAKSQDYDNNGIMDTWYVDTDKNGTFDTCFIDDNEDGYPEGTMIDENENGIYELIIVDTDKDGKANEAYIDEDEDKKLDVRFYDYDQDGKWDKSVKLS